MKPKNETRFLTGLVVLAILFNLGAVFSTNFLIGLNYNPEEVYVIEMNPVVREGMMEENAGFVEEVPPEIKKSFDNQYKLFLYLVAIWSIITIVFYTARRRFVRSDYKDEQAFLNMAFVAWFSVIVTGFNFINDVSYVIGYIIGGL